MPKLINYNQKNLIECDGPNCDYVIPNPTGDPHEPTGQYINQPCPKCGTNLLTQKDSDDFNQLLRRIDWLNKWFGWLGWFSFGQEKETIATAKVHEGKVVIKDE